VLGRACWYRPCNLAVVLRASDRSRCGAARTLISLADSRQLVRVMLLSLWRGAHVDIA
jgi:hypothetical protein